MASLHAISPHSLLPLSKSKKPTSKILPSSHFLGSKFTQSLIFSRNKQQRGESSWLLNSVVQEELDVIPVQSEDSVDQQEGMVMSQVESEGSDQLATQVSGFGSSEGQLSFEGFSSASSSSGIGDDEERRQRELEMDRLADRTLNAMIVLAAGSFAITKLLTIDQDYWHAGWKLWPFAHLITYGVVPVEQRLLWVDCVELIWVTILSTYSNEKSEARIAETPAEATSSSLSKSPAENERLHHHKSLKLSSKLYSKDAKMLGGIDVELTMQKSGIAMHHSQKVEPDNGLANAGGAISLIFFQECAVRE
ncbi:conserved hypothetical protein [Ricinus communis]|uniref:Peroxisomal membrane protein n=1 Tax=Ricinus communis TaxID=3988 RepID=B9SW12_RICCO|nr:conserved hypothetical protein [Ricinus communis]